jgi:amino acid transporter
MGTVLGESVTAAVPNEECYRQELSREISTGHNVLISLSALTPASSVFVIVPGVLATAGTGSVLAMLLAAGICLLMGFCWAELGAAYPTAGGDYPLVYHALRGPLRSLAAPISFMLFVLQLLNGMTATALLALGIAQYVPIQHSFNPTILAAALTLVAALVASLNIRTNAAVTGTFLIIELSALSSLIVLGIVHFHARFGEIIHGWVVGTGQGILMPVPLTAVVAAASIGIFAYNGFNNPIYFSEETRGGSRSIASAVLWSLAIGVTAELLPTIFVIFGAPNLAKITTSDVPMSEFVLSTSGTALNAVSAGIALAIFNALIAVILSLSRMIYASGRDRAYPGKLNDWITVVHPRVQSPWVATLVVGFVASTLCVTVSTTTLINLTATGLIFAYSLIAISALVGRACGATVHSPYRMPFWPVVPILALLALFYIGIQQRADLLLITLVELGIGLVWWAIVVQPQGNKAWRLKQPRLE